MYLHNYEIFHTTKQCNLHTILSFEKYFYHKFILQNQDLASIVFYSVCMTQGNLLVKGRYCWLLPHAGIQCALLRPTLVFTLSIMPNDFYPVLNGCWTRLSASISYELISWQCAHIFEFTLSYARRFYCTC